MRVKRTHSEKSRIRFFLHGPPPSLFAHIYQLRACLRLCAHVCVCTFRVCVRMIFQECQQLTTNLRYTHKYRRVNTQTQSKKEREREEERQGDWGRERGR